jgi:hypothetical protein
MEGNKKVNNITGILMVDSVIAKKPVIFTGEAISLFHKSNPPFSPLFKGGNLIASHRRSKKANSQ